MATATIINAMGDEQKKDPTPGLQDDKQGNHDLKDTSPDLVTAMVGLLKHFGELDRFSRRQEVVETRRQRFYDRGYQYIYFNANSYVFVPVVGGVTVNAGDETVAMPRYTNVYNIYKPYRRNFTAPLTQNPPGVNFEASDPPKELDRKSAEAAEKYVEHIQQVNPEKKLQQEISRLFWTDGRVCLWTRTVHDDGRFGSDKDGEPNGEEVIDAYGVLECKVIPIVAKNQSALIFACISDEPEVNIAKAEYEWAADEIKTGPSEMGETAYERNARLGVLQGTRLWAQSADAFAHLVTRHVAFFRPAAFKHAPADQREALKEMFPNGLKMVVVGDVYCESFNCSMDDELTVRHALDGDGMNRPSWGKDAVPLQDAYNNYRNMRQEYHDYGIPFTAIHPECGDLNAFREMISQPGSYVNADLPQGMQSLGDAFFTPAAVTVPPDLVQAIQDIRDAEMQLITGVQSAVFGGTVGKDEQKVGVYAMAREQALGVIGLPWGTMQEMFASAYKQACLLAAKRTPDAVVHINRQANGGLSKPIDVELGDLAKGSFRAVPNTDSSFPETRSARKSAYTEFMTAAEFNPQLMEAAMQPDNLEMGKDLQGLPDLVIPAAQAANRQRDEIDMLLQQQPVPDQQAYMDALLQHAQQEMQMRAQGAQPELVPPPPDQTQFMKASVDVDPIFDQHKYHFDTVMDWLNGIERDRELAKGNVLGVENVRLHGIAHQKLIPTQQPPPMPMRPPAPPPGAAPAAAAPQGT